MGPLVGVVERRQVTGAIPSSSLPQMAPNGGLFPGCTPLPACGPQKGWPQGAGSCSVLTPQSTLPAGSIPQQSCTWYRDAASPRMSPRQQLSGPLTPTIRTTWVIQYPVGWSPPRPAATAPLAPCVTAAAPAQMGLRLPEMPGELLQSFMDWLPAFADRARMCAVCSAVRCLEWRLAPPLQPDEELSGVGLRDRGARAVAWAFAKPQHPAIGELCLGGNGIGDAGALAIAAVLGSGSTIRRLSLRDNRITDIGARAIAAAMATNTALEELDLWGNELSGDGKSALLSSAKCKVFLELDFPRAPSTPPVTPAAGRMRAVLLDWISQVHTGGNAPVALDGEADPQDLLFRTFAHLDVYFSVHNVRRTELQLTGVACTLAAARLYSRGAQEGDSELASWLAFVTDGACTAEDVRDMARKVQEELGFKMHQPTAYTFLRRYLRKTGWTQESFSLANYLIELAVIDSKFTRYRPQALAAAATVLSRQYLSQGIGFQHIPGWKAKLLRCSYLDLQEELAPCTAAMARLHAAQQGQPGKFVNKKYEWARLHMVAKIVPNPPADAAFFESYLSGDSSA